MDEEGEFSRVLREALRDATNLRGRVSEVLGRVAAGGPAEIFEAAKHLEQEAQDSRPVIERLVAIVRGAHVHTLQSAYALLRQTAGRREDAERLRQLIAEYRGVKAEIALAASNVDAAIASLGKAGLDGGVPGNGTNGERRGALLAKI